jgi:hypothetical protein
MDASPMWTQTEDKHSTSAIEWSMQRRQHAEDRGRLRVHNRVHSRVHNRYPEPSDGNTLRRREKAQGQDALALLRDAGMGTHVTNQKVGE